MNLPLEVDVSSRDCFVHLVQVEKASKVLEWSFATKKKSINFGLFYSNDKNVFSGSPAVAASQSPSTSALNTATASTTETRGSNADAVGEEAANTTTTTVATTGATSTPAITTTTFTDTTTSNVAASRRIPPPVATRTLSAATNASSTHSKRFFVPSFSGVRRFGRQRSASAASSLGGGSANASQTTPMGSLVLDSLGATSPIERSPITEAIRRMTQASASVGNEGAGSPSIPAVTVDEDLLASLEVVVPLKRYNAAAFAVKGSHVVDKPGFYIFVFDNSFSRATSKHVTFYVNVSDQGAATSTELPELCGWLLKKKRKTHQGWAKRWVHLKDGVLSYYASPTSDCRGSISVNAASISTIADQKLIVLDSGSMIYFFKSIEEKDFEKWVDAIRLCRKSFINRGVSTEEVTSPTQEAATLPTRETNTSRRFLSEFIEINDRLLSTEDDMEELKLLMRKHTRDMPGEVMDSMEELLTKFERIHSTLAACSMRMMSQNTLSRSHRRNISTSKDSVSGPLGGGGLRSSQNLAVPKSNAISNTGSMKQAPSINSVYFDAEEVSLDEIRSIRSEEQGEEEIYQIVTDVQKMDSVSDFYTDHDDDDDQLQLAEGSQFFSDEKEPSVKSTSIHSTSVATTSRRRKALPCDMSSEGVSVLSILRKNIGKDLSSVAMPVSLNEPLNALQRLCEELEYRHLLDKAAACQSSLERMKWLAAFAVSGFSYAASRTRKPFNPMLGETYEWESESGDVRFIAEKVHHNPHVMACYAESENYTFSQCIQNRSKFWGKSIELTPIGRVSVHLKSWSETYSWNKVNTHVSVIGSNSIEYYGDMKITNAETGEEAIMAFKESGYFASKKNQIEGVILDANGDCKITLSGSWSEALFCELDDNKLEVIWKCNPLPPHAPEQYGFTWFAMELNELDARNSSRLPATDTRFRPDQRLFEEGHIAEAEKKKFSIEQKQRAARQEMQANHIQWEPRYFTRTQDPQSGEEDFVFKGNYWKLRETGAFPNDKLW